MTVVTEFKYGSISKAYLSAVPDLYGRNIVVFSLSRRNNTPLVLDTFEQAFQKYPDAKPLLHSDRGVQYTSRSFRKEMKRAGVCQSMSRVGRCLDNAPMEGFWGILKTESITSIISRITKLCGRRSAHILTFITMTGTRKSLAV